MPQRDSVFGHVLASISLSIASYKFVRGWRGVAVERRVRDREVAGSRLGRACTTA